MWKARAAAYDDNPLTLREMATLEDDVRQFCRPPPGSPRS